MLKLGRQCPIFPTLSGVIQGHGLQDVCVSYTTVGGQVPLMDEGLSPAPGPCRSPWAGVRTVLHCRLLIICALVLHLQNGILLPSVSRHLRSLK